MKKIISLTILLSLSASLSFLIAQQAIKKSRDVAKFSIGEKGEKKATQNTLNFSINVTILKGWQLYAHRAGVEGPQPTVFQSVNDTFQIKKVTESKPKEKYEEVFNGKTRVFENKAKFSLQTTVSKNAKHSVKITFMVCKDDVCLPPDSIDLDI